MLEFFATIAQWFSGWFGKKSPVSQQSHGDKAVQVGDMPEGRVQVLHVQNLNVIQQTSQTNHIGAHPSDTIVNVSTTLAVLEQLEPYGKREKVLEFMKTTFGTRMVKQLDERALKRTHAYAQKVLQNEKDKGSA